MKTMFLGFVKFSFVAVLMLNAWHTAYAGEMVPPPKGLADDDSIFQSKSNAMHDVTSTFQFGAQKIIWEETKINRVSRAIGTGRVDMVSGDESGPHWLCYTILSQAQPQRVWILTDAFHAGTEVYGVDAALLSKGDDKPSESCPRIGLQPQRIFLDSGIWLGQSVSEIERLIGAKAVRSGAYIVFKYLRQLDKNYTVATSVYFEIQNERAIRLWTTKYTAN